MENSHFIPELEPHPVRRSGSFAQHARSGLQADSCRQRRLQAGWSKRTKPGFVPQGAEQKSCTDALRLLPYGQKRDRSGRRFHHLGHAATKVPNELRPFIEHPLRSEPLDLAVTEVGRAALTLRVPILSTPPQNIISYDNEVPWRCSLQSRRFTPDLRRLRTLFLVLHQRRSPKLLFGVHAHQG